MSRTARRGVEDLKESAQEMKEGVRGAANDLLHKAQQFGSEASSAVRESLDGMRDTATDYYRTGRDKARDFEQALEQRVQDRPLMSVLAAVGIGFLVGYLCKRS
jgi:ElaB/YqjD/DUF883 family membrane-anchored ribosome-binding protein